MKRIIFIVAIISLSLTACIKDKKIDASDEETLKKSVEAVQKTLSAKDQKAFEEALQLLIFAEIENQGGLFALAGKDPDNLASDLYKTLDGKSAKEIIKIGEEKQKKIKIKQLESINDEISELQKRKTEAEGSADVLTKIEISNPKFYWATEYYNEKPIIDFTIKNNTQIAIAKGYFHGTVASPGRTIPWISEEFNYEFKGGLEPNETKSLQLAPNMFGDWSVSETKERDDLVMTIDVVNAQNAEGNRIAITFGKEDNKRLETLLEKKQQLILELN